jgi:hypothetical protein
MANISLDDDTFHDDKSPLKEDAKANIPCIFVTLETSQEDRSPLKAEAV